MKKLCLLSLVAVSVFTLTAKDNFITGVFINPVDRYFDMDMEANNDSYPVEEIFVEDIIETVSGMIYGWEFSYTPSDYKRQIDEVFILEPIAKIKKGDPQMSFRDNWVKNHIMYQNLVYRLNEHQKKRIKSWKTTLNPTSVGEGYESIFTERGKSISLKEAIKDSIKLEFQSRGDNKPRLITGRILLNDVPRQFISSGSYTTKVKTIIIYREIKKYKYH